MLIDLKREIIHDTTLSDFREPVGAVRTGGRVTLRLKTRCPDVQSVYVRLFHERYEKLYMMQPLGDVWSAELTAPESPEAYWYYFLVNIGGHVSYYGSEGGKQSGMGTVYTEPPPAFQLTVYAADFETPAWFRKSILYQIFPDRFCRTDGGEIPAGIAYHQSRGRKVYYHRDWNELPLYRPIPGEKDYNPSDYFGGTLKGIEESLDYLKKLGIGAVYLNPVFEAASNHRYNTADYMKIDPILGTNEDFKSLCKKAEALGIRIILDGVFSHTGSDSIYFNRERAYENPGAYNSPDSTYYSWYKFEHYPDKYKAWWGFKTLPEVNEQNPDWQNFVITGEDSVLKHWLSEGAGGYRLDVADELPDEALMLIRKSVKQKDPEAVIIGEVWEDATTKYSYGQKRKFASGLELDSVTNYPFRNAVVDFLCGKKDAYALRDFMLSQATNYPPPMYYALMNLLSSHDIERIRTALAARIDPHALSREQQAGFTVRESQNLKGAKLQRLAVTLQMTVPGVPCIYYGDETGMQGLLDPFNRGPFHKGSVDLTEDYIKLCGIRNNADALSTGKATFFAPNADCFGILRYILDERDAFGQPAKNGVYFAAVNRSDKMRHVVFDFLGATPLVAADEKMALRGEMRRIARSLLSEDTYEINDALLEVTLQPYGLLILKIV